MDGLHMHAPRSILPALRRPGLAVLALALALALVTAACGGGSGSADPTASDVGARSTTTSSPPAPSSPPPPASATAAPTTPAPGAPVYPLTGLPVDDPALAARPALVVKIDNAPGARPQTGFNEADMVYEEIVNDDLTRFAMIFQSGDSDPVGPIRSGRIQDIDLFGSLNHPLFSWSGGNPTVTAAIDASDLVNIGPSKARVYFRSGGRKAPHNLYSSTADLFAQAPRDAAPPAQQFAHRADGEAAAGSPSSGVDLSLDAVDVSWEWDASTGLYRRRMEGVVHTDAATGEQITANNVVVLVMRYANGISGSPDAQSVGTGEAFVFTGGNGVHATWTRTDRLLPFTLTGDDGKVVGLTPGRTFVELPRAGETSPRPAG